MTTARAPRSPRPRLPAVEVAGISVPAGRRVTVELPIARLPTLTQLSMPLVVTHGARPGPTMWLSAVIHGDELNGLEIIRQVLAAVPVRALSGTLIAAPTVNVFGMLNESRYLPDRRDLNRHFPGSPHGSLAARLADLFMTEVVARADVGIDLHTGSDHRFNLPQVRSILDDPRNLALAEAFAAPVTIHSPLRDGSLRAACARRGLPVLIYEGGEADRFNETAITAGTSGVLRVLAHLEMVDPERVAVPPRTRRTRIVRRTSWIRARRSGILRAGVRAGQEVERGETLGVISDAAGGARAVVRAPFSGIVIGHTQHPLVHKGDALVHLADPDPAARGSAARSLS